MESGMLLSRIFPHNAATSRLTEPSKLFRRPRPISQVRRLDRLSRMCHGLATNGGMDLLAASAAIFTAEIHCCNAAPTVYILPPTTKPE